VFSCRDYQPDEGNHPSKCSNRNGREREWIADILSILMPRMLAALRPLLSIPPFILRSDGECSDPYDGIGKMFVGEINGGV